MTLDLKLPALVLAVVGVLLIAIGFVWPLVYSRFFFCPCPAGAYCNCPAGNSYQLIDELISLTIGVVCLVAAALLAKRSAPVPTTPSEAPEATTP
jgi:hypothetical protein